VSATAAAPVLVLHGIGDAGGGGPWRAALVAAGWTGPVLAPDLPGHAGAPPPEGGQHEPGDGAFLAVRTLAAAEVERGAPVVVGVGVNGWNAQLCGLGGRASAVVLVDGLGGPWVPVRDAVLAGRDQLRAIAADPEAVAPMAPGAPLDPRLRHGLPTHGSRTMAFEAAAVMPVPVLVVESPGSATPHDDASALAAAMGAGGTLVRVAEPSPAVVAKAVVEWCR
jgi:pimeloyl-ACP methyl ester carboxylesterase